MAARGAILHRPAYNSPMTPALDVCVRGAGPVGRTLALLLAAQRLRVGLVANVSPNPSTRSDIRAYALNAASRQLLESLRAWPQEAEQTTPVLHMRVFGDAQGRVNFDAKTQGVPALAWIVEAAALQARLEQACAYQSLVHMLDAPQNAALTVICEGQSSTSREALGIELEPLPYRQSALATRVNLAQPHGQNAWQWFSQGEVLAFLPIGGAEGNSMAVVWSVNHDRVESLHALDDAGLAQALAEASGQALGAMSILGARASWRLQMGQAGHWCGAMPDGDGAWALAGDAAHQVHPLAGQGLNIGLADAQALAETLGTRSDSEAWRSPGDLRLLRRYERSRKLALAAPNAVLDGLQRLFAVQGETWRELRNAGMQGFDRLRPLKAWVAARAMGSI